MKIPRVTFQELDSIITGGPQDSGVGDDSVEVEAQLSPECFALDVEELGTAFQAGKTGTAVFSCRFGAALDGMYLLRKSRDSWFLCRLVRTESPEQESPRFRPSRRKSFMTPTPLHIPGSRVSPIPDYTHAVFYLEPVGEKRIEIVKAGQTDCLFPLVHLEKKTGKI